jgi:uncharacterized protein (TIGR03089 family)
VAQPTPEGLFDARLAADPGAPLVTFYDDATGERAELSAKSCANWIAKTYFLLTDSLGLGPGDAAFVRLPVHWLAVPVLFGCWYAGLQVVTEPGAAVAFADADSLAGLGRVADEVFAVSLLSMARPGTPPAGAEDFALSVRPMPDAWSGVRALGAPEALALDGLDRAALAARAGGLATSSRLLWSREWSSADDWVAAVLAPVAAGGSTVLVRNPDPAALERRVATERITVRG